MLAAESRKNVFEKLASPGARPEDGPEVRIAQMQAHARLVAPMYFILLCNACVLAYTFRAKAPAWLTLHPAAVFALFCGWRIVAWRQLRGQPPSDAVARSRHAATCVLAAVLAAALSAWGILLFPYGDAFDQGHVAFFLAFTMVSAMLCLVHAPPAPLCVAVCAGVPFVVFFGHTGTPVFLAEAFDVILVTVAAVLIIHIQGRNYARLVAARAEAGRRQQEQERLLRMIEDLPFAVMTVDPATLCIDYVNAAGHALVEKIEHLLPVRADALLGTCIDVFHRHPEHQRRMLADPSRLPHTARLTLGDEILEFKVSAITDSAGGYLGPMLAFALVTQQVQAERRILHLAHHDALTGLVNRHALREQLHTRLSGRGEALTLLTVDLDGFKTVNDTLGHRSGDALLAAVAARLQSRVGGRAATIARLGGDEFTVLMPGDDAAQAQALAGSLLQALHAPFVLPDERQVRIGASIGIAAAPRDGRDGETLLSRADIALYAAKSAGRGSVRCFTAEMLASIQERVDLEARLRAALEARRGLFVFYQPIQDLATGRVTAREALVRWHEPGRGWISPAAFVPVAEQTELIDRLAEFVLDAACREAAGWTDGARVAVNVSAVQLGKGTLLPVVRQALERAALRPERLEIELTETALLRHGAETLAELQALRALGVRLALDDFGTGCSSLAHLRAFAFDKIKIDGSFVREAVVRQDCAAVVRAVAEIGRRLGITTVAEGVETQAHLDCVREEGCSEVQGYFLGRPAPAACDEPAVRSLDAAAAREPEAA